MRWFCYLYFVIEPLLLIVLFPLLYLENEDLDHCQTNVGNAIVYQRKIEGEPGEESSIVIEKRIPIFHDLFFRKYLDSIEKRSLFVEFKVIDNQFIEYKKNGEVLRVKVN